MSNTLGLVWQTKGIDLSFVSLYLPETTKNNAQNKEQ